MEEMRAAGIQPEVVTWNPLVKAHVDKSDVAGARAVMEEMRVAGVNPDKVTWNTLLTAYVDKSDIAGARAVMEEMRAAGANPDKFTGNMLMNCLVNCSGDMLSSAEEVARNMEKDGIVLDAYGYATLIRCCYAGRAAHPHNPARATHWFSLYVSGWRNRGPLEPIVAHVFKTAVGYKVAADVCKDLGLDLGSLLERRPKGPRSAKLTRKKHGRQMVPAGLAERKRR
jgi:pentatricopeptide repeat protein